MEEIFKEGNINRMIIGVGGEGCRIVEMVANYLHSHGGLPPSQAFIFIDSNAEDVRSRCKEIKTKDDRIYHIILAGADRNIFIGKNPWLPEIYAATIGGIGAGTRRAFGKALYNIQSGTIQTIIYEAASKLRTSTNEEGFIINIVGALGGGTGSSIIGDLSIDIMEWMKAITNKDPIIFGFGILPAIGEEDTINILNAMAALKELHFILSLKEKKGKYINPFKLFVLVGRKIEGVKDDNTRREIARRFFTDLGFMPGNKKKTSDKWYDMNDLITAISGLESSFSTMDYKSIEFPADLMIRLYETEDQIKYSNNLKNDIEVKKTSINNKFSSLENQIKSIKTNIENMDAQVNALELDMGWLSNKKAMKETRTRLEKTKQQMKEDIESRDLLINLLNAVEANEIKINKELAKLNAQKDSLHEKITQSSDSVRMHRVSLNDGEIDQFREEKQRVRLDANSETAFTFNEIMAQLKRQSELERHVKKPFIEHSVCSHPLLKYEHKKKKDFINPLIIKKLTDWKLIEIDAQNEIVDEESKLGRVASIISSHESNINEAELGLQNVKQTLEETIAKKAVVFPLHVPLDKFSVDIHTLMIGLLPWAPAPEQATRLKDLDIMQNMYLKSSEEELFLHHSLFFGDSSMFRDITKEQISIGDSRGSASSILKFWKKYQLVDKSANWSKLKITFADIYLKIEDLDDKLSIIINGLKMLDVDKQFSPNGLSNILFSLQKLNDDLKMNLFINYKSEFFKLDSYLLEFNKQFATSDVIDSDTAGKIQTVIDDTSNRIKAVQNKINSMEKLMDSDAKQRLHNIGIFIENIPADQKFPNVQNQMTNVMGILEKISPIINETSKTLLQIGVPLNEIQGNIQGLKGKLERIGRL